MGEAKFEIFMTAFYHLLLFLACLGYKIYQSHQQSKLKNFKSIPQEDITDLYQTENIM
jgi:hypothetical protein